MNQKIKASLLSFLIIGVIFAVAYFSLQPDPKGIRISTFTMFFGLISVIAGSYFGFKRTITNPTMHALTMVGNGVNVYLSFIMLKSLISGDIPISFWLLIEGIFFFGSVLFLMLLDKVIRYTILQKN